MTADWPNLKSVAGVEVTSVLAGLPGELRTKSRGVAIVFERSPGPELLEDGIEPDVLGLFTGSTREEHLSGEGLFPPQITLFLENLLEYAEGDEAEYRREVRITLLHELGHYLGLDEEDLFDRGL